MARPTPTLGPGGGVGGLVASLALAPAEEGIRFASYDEDANGPCDDALIFRVTQKGFFFLLPRAGLFTKDGGNRSALRGSAAPTLCVRRGPQFREPNLRNQSIKMWTFYPRVLEN